MAALSDAACSRRLLFRRFRTSSSRAALSAFSWGCGRGRRTQNGRLFTWGSPVNPWQTPGHPVTFCRSSCSFLSMDSR